MLDDNTNRLSLFLPYLSQHIQSLYISKRFHIATIIVTFTEVLQIGLPTESLGKYFMADVVSNRVGRCHFLGCKFAQWSKCHIMFVAIFIRDKNLFDVW